MKARRPRCNIPLRRGTCRSSGRGRSGKSRGPKSVESQTSQTGPYHLGRAQTAKKPKVFRSNTPGVTPFVEFDCPALPLMLLAVARSVYSVSYIRVSGRGLEGAVGRIELPSGVVTHVHDGRYSPFLPTCRLYVVVTAVDGDSTPSEFVAQLATKVVVDRHGQTHVSVRKHAESRHIVVGYR